MDAREVIERLGLEPLPREGGWYRETYRAALTLGTSALPAIYGRDKAASTAIYYLLTAGSCSRLHRLPTDELFHFHIGDAVEILVLSPDGSSALWPLGGDLARGDHPQVVVPAHAWQGSRVRPGGAWALMGVTVAPGFDFSDYDEPADIAPLLARWPDREVLIRELAPR